MMDLYEHTRTAMKSHAWQQVIEDLSDRTLKKASDWRLYWNRGWCHMKLEEPAKALTYFLGSLKHTEAPTDRATCLTFAGMAALAGQNSEAATNYLMQALTLEDRTLTRKYLALAHVEEGKPEAAERVHRSGLAKAPDDRERMAAYGDFLLDQGRIEEALALKDRLDGPEKPTSQG